MTKLRYKLNCHIFRLNRIGLNYLRILFPVIQRLKNTYWSREIPPELELLCFIPRIQISWSWYPCWGLFYSDEQTLISSFQLVLQGKITTGYLIKIKLICRLTNKENRIYIKAEITSKCKTAILLYCFHTAGVLHIFMLYNLLGPGTSFYRKSKINVKRKPNYEIGWFHILTNDHFPLQTMIFRYSYKSNDVFYSQNSL